MQQSPQVFNGTPTANITTEQIQKYLDENKELILAIMENQNQGKFAECAPYHAQLQQNLTYLAQIADAQPQAPTMPSQMPSQSTMHQGLLMQHPQATMFQQQTGPIAPKLPFQLNDQHQYQHQQQRQQQQHQQSKYLQQQQLIQGQMGVRPGGTSGNYQAMQAGLGNNLFGIQGSKQDSSEAGAEDFVGKL
ncbi:GRF1-interacting factor 2-like [Corylus avellana]|uniref:GRF1-interacting factor 2-like n=1 Tax=Corylus avellana TaxID=13451 RepID=UPI00286D3123|nr:GRF1-interacting factor 2-like [Corylus avellana]